MDNYKDSLTQQDILQQILFDPPPYFNPLIGLLHNDTLLNVYDSLSTLQELAASSSTGEVNLSSTSGNGLYFLLCCIKDALHFEIDHRDKMEMTDR